NADVERLALPVQLGKGAHGLLERRVGVVAMRIEDIDIVEAHALKALLARGDEVFAAAEIAVGAGPHAPAGLRRADQLIAVGAEIARHDVAEELFGRARRGAVVVGEIEMRDAVVEGVAQDLERARIVARAAEILPEAERDGGEFQPRTT